eukprot:1716135-Pyramimonas_sp.AAC.1
MLAWNAAAVFSIAVLSSETPAAEGPRGRGRGGACPAGGASGGGADRRDKMSWWSCMNSRQSLHDGLTQRRNAMTSDGPRWAKIGRADPDRPGPERRRSARAWIPGPTYAIRDQPDLRLPSAYRRSTHTPQPEPGQPWGPAQAEAAASWTGSPAMAARGSLMRSAACAPSAFGVSATAIDVCS